MKITVCIGSSCHLKGSRTIVERLEQLILEYDLKDKIDLRGSFCMGHCRTGVSVLVDDKYYSLTPEDTEHFVKQTILPRFTQTNESDATQIEPI